MCDGCLLPKAQSPDVALSSRPEGVSSSELLVVTSAFDAFEASAAPIVKTIYDELIDLIKSSKGGSNNA